MDSYFHSLRVEGVGAEVKHASTISKDEENQFWEQGVFVSVHPFGIAMSCFIAMEGFLFAWSEGALSPQDLSVSVSHRA